MVIGMHFEAEADEDSEIFFFDLTTKDFLHAQSGTAMTNKQIRYRP